MQLSYIICGFKSKFYVVTNVKIIFKFILILVGARKFDVPQIIV